MIYVILFGLIINKEWVVGNGKIGNWELGMGRRYLVMGNA